MAAAAKKELDPAFDYLCLRVHVPDIVYHSIYFGLKVYSPYIGTGAKVYTIWVRGPEGCQCRQLLTGIVGALDLKRLRIQVVVFFWGVGSSGLGFRVYYTGTWGTSSY